MKLYHPKHGVRNNNKHKHKHKQGFLLILKWLILFLFSIYLLFSFTSTTPITLSRFSAAAITRRNSAIHESTSTTTTHPDINDSRIDVKVYIYDLPGHYNADWLAADSRCGTHLFASEVAIHRALLSSPEFRTLDPYEADFFFIPVYVSCNFSKVNGFPAIGHARGLISSAVELISTTFPFWNRSRGTDHVFVASHDFGACFHTMEDAAVADGVTEVMRNSIVLQTFGVEGRHPCQDVEHVVIPPYVSPESVRKTLDKRPLNGGRGRDIFAFFRGKMEVHPKNVSGRFYSKTVRTKIWKKYATDRRFYLRRERFSGYQTEIARSFFCLCPLGWAPWSPRLVESVALGCVPVIIADGIRLPFTEAIPWPEISLRVHERSVDRLEAILDHVARTNLTAIQANIRRPEVRRALMFNDEVEDGDATWQVMRELARRVGDRSRSRRRMGSQ